MKPDDKLAIQTETTVQKLEDFERSRYHVKIALYLIVGAIIVGVNIFTFHRLYENSSKNRQLLRCAVLELTSANQNPQIFRSDLQTCLDSTK